MSFLGSMFSDSKGAGFQGTAADQTNAVNTGQTDAAYSAAQQGLGNQASLLNQAQGQNGFSNQANVYNQQQGLANQLQGMSQGQGPNPAQAQLAQATGQNVSNQAALMAGQRGAGSNAGMLARQAAQQGATTQQQAVGQSATLQAQQQMNAINALQQQQSMLGSMANQQVGQQSQATQGYNQAAQSEQQQMLGAINAQNQNAVSMQGNLNNVNASIAQGNQAAQSGLTSGLMQGAGSMLSLAHGGSVRQMYADGGPTLGIEGLDPAPPQPNLGIQGLDKAPSEMNAPNLGIGNLASSQAPVAPISSGPQSSIGQLLSSSGEGSGSAPEIAAPTTNAGSAAIAQGWNKAGTSGDKGLGGVMSNITGLLGGGGSSGGDDSGGGKSGGGGGAGGAMSLLALLSKGGKVPALVSPGERYLSPEEVQLVLANRKKADKAGEKIPGKASIKGDSLKNDTVKKTLDEGGIVIPRSVMNSKDKAAKAKSFVEAHSSSRGMKAKKK